MGLAMGKTTGGRESTEEIPRKLKRRPTHRPDKERARLIEKICKAGGRVVAPPN